jgi:hypothetical protein
MTTSDIIGTAGVSLLLLAFLLNLAGVLHAEARVYQGMNAAGAGIACLSAYLIGFFPFVVLEGAWALASMVALVRAAR